MQIQEYGTPSARSVSESTSPRRQLYIRARARARARFWSYHDRNEYECPSCGRTQDEVDGPWHVHHKDRDPLNNEYVNLVGLCIWCHRRGHSYDAARTRIESWKQQFHDLGGDGQ